MSKLHEIVRLVMTSTLSDRDIALSLHVAKNTVRRYRIRTHALGRGWTELKQLPGAELESLFNKRQRGLTQKRAPDFATIHEDLQRHGVTLLLLWEEYRAACPQDALSYSQFTHRYREFSRTVSFSMRQVHPPGARAFVDFSGKRPRYVDPATGEPTFAELFVGCLGYSHLL